MRVIRIVPEDIMALYSWFLRTKTAQNKKTIKVNNDLVRASESVRYIENYTMWPTAKIKQDVKVIVPSFSGLDNTPTEQQKTLLPPNKTTLADIKS